VFAAILIIVPPSAFPKMARVSRVFVLVDVRLVTPAATKAAKIYRPAVANSLEVCPHGLVKTGRNRGAEIGLRHGPKSIARLRASFGTSIVPSRFDSGIPN